MKINVEIDLNEVFYDCEMSEVSANEGIKSHILQSVANKLLANNESDLIAQIKETQSKLESDFITKVDKTLNETVDKLADKLLNEELHITDEWGKTIEKDITLENLIKKKLQRTFEEKVDEKGRTANGYSAYCSRLEYLTTKAIESRVEKELKKFNDNLEKNVKAEVKKVVEGTVTSNITNFVLENIKPLNDKGGQG